MLWPAPGAGRRTAAATTPRLRSGESMLPEGPYARKREAGILRAVRRSRALRGADRGRVRAATADGQGAAGSRLRARAETATVHWRSAAKEWR
jgi:hypothetical protein